MGMETRTYNSDPKVEAHKEDLRRQINAVVRRHRLACEVEIAPMAQELTALTAMDDRCEAIVVTWPSPI